MPEARHLNPYLWCLSYAAGYPQTQTNLIKNHNHFQKKKTNQKVHSQFINSFTDKHWNSQLMQLSRV